jgi:hypothetical protein
MSIPLINSLSRCSSLEVNPSFVLASAASASSSINSQATRQVSLPAFNVHDLLLRKLADPKHRVRAEESIALLAECIKQGEAEAKKAEKQNLVVIIGNTGAGKSTLANALCGCTMQRVNPKKIGMTGFDPLVIVKPTTEGGHRDEIMPIGHTRNSMTFMPQLVSMDNRFTLCDCPGFLDNRGYEINIANAVNIKNTFIKAKSVKIVILINYHSLLADRARGLSDVIKICCDLFGSKENLEKYKNMIFFCLSVIASFKISFQLESVYLYSSNSLVSGCGKAS